MTRVTGLYLPITITHPTITHHSTETTARMSAPASKFKVADISLAAFGRREIELAEHECVVQVNALPSL